MVTDSYVNINSVNSNETTRALTKVTSQLLVQLLAMTTATTAAAMLPLAARPFFSRFDSGWKALLR